MVASPSPYVYSLAFLLSLSLFLLFLPRILPPKPLRISLSDDLDDLSLFRKAATSVSSSTSTVSRLGSNNPNPKIAFLFLTNSDIKFAPLWEKFFEGKQDMFNVYVHADPTIILNTPGGVFEGRFVSSKRTERASPTLISATRRLLANAILDDPLNLYFAVLSQHCIPLHSFNFIYKSLFGEPANATMAVTAQQKQESFIEILSELRNMLERYHARGRNIMLPEVPFEKFKVGSQFFVLAKRHALIIIRDRKLWRKFKLPCLNMSPCYPEEHYFSTLLSMEDPAGCSHYTLTRVNWTGSVGGHPHLYQPEELSPQLLHSLSESNKSHGYFFARKFSPNCLNPLLEMADKVLFKD